MSDAAAMNRDADGTMRPYSDAENAQRARDAEASANRTRQALGSALRDALKTQGWDTAWTAAMALQSDDTKAWWVSAYRDLVPITATKLVRVASACVPKVDLPALYAAAGA